MSEDFKLPTVPRRRKKRVTMRSVLPGYAFSGFRSVYVSCSGAISIPNPTASEQEARRWDCSDLPDLDDFELWRELKRIESALVWCSDSAYRPWLEKRYKAIQAERRAREDA